MITYFFDLLLNCFVLLIDCDDFNMLLFIIRIPGVVILFSIYAFSDKFWDKIKFVFSHDYHDNPHRPTI